MRCRVAFTRNRIRGTETPEYLVADFQSMRGMIRPIGDSARIPPERHERGTLEDIVLVRVRSGYLHS